MIAEMRRIISLIVFIATLSEWTAAAAATAALSIPNQLPRLLSNGISQKHNTQSDQDFQQFYVEIEPGTSKSQIRELINNHGGTVERVLRKGNILTVTITNTKSTQLLRNDPQVRSLEPVPRYKKLQFEGIPYGIDSVKAREVWNFGDDRNGNIGREFATMGNRDVIVCVIDDGLNPDHEDLQGLNIVNTNPIEEWTSCDGCSHGQHVTGVISAQLNSLGLVGIAPNVSIAVVRVFEGDTFSYPGGLIGAVEDCEGMGANVISMSLGSFFSSQSEKDAFAESSALLVAAAGNAGNDLFSFPASYPNVLSVGAVDQANVLASFSQRNDQIDLVAPGVSVNSTIMDFVERNMVSFSEDNPEDQMSYPVYEIIGSDFDTVTAPLLNTMGFCTLEEMLSIGIDELFGKICHCRIGAITFEEKAENGFILGCAAVLVSNDPGYDLFFGTLEFQYPFIVASTDGNTRVQLESLPNDQQSLVTIGLNSVDPYSSYTTLDGTSMACPHVSGVAALLFSAVPDANPNDIKACLINTALDLGSPGRDNAYGYGLVQADQAYLCALKILRRRQRTQLSETLTL